MARRTDVTRNQGTVQVAYISLVIIRISIGSPYVSCKKRRSGSISDILSGVKVDRAVDLIIIYNAWLFK